MAADHRLDPDNLRDQVAHRAGRPAVAQAAFAVEQFPERSRASLHHRAPSLADDLQGIDVPVIGAENLEEMGGEIGRVDLRQGGVGEHAQDAGLAIMVGHIEERREDIRLPAEFLEQHAIHPAVGINPTLRGIEELIDRQPEARGGLLVVLRTVLATHDGGDHGGHTQCMVDIGS